MLSAARDLFDRHGYQGTTIREIARHAGVAVGSVFTTFASKGEILSEVMQARLDPLYAEFDRVVPHLRGSTMERLQTLFAIHFNFESQHIRLFLSHIAAAYDWTLPPNARPFGRTPRLQDILRDCLTKGLADGDVRPDLDIRQTIDLLMAAYAWTYHRVITENADVGALTAAMDRQIRLIAEGFQAR